MRRSRRTSALLFAAVAALGLGMVLVTGGVRVAPLFMPGVLVLGAGFLLAALAGGLSLLDSDDGAADA